MTSAGSIVSSSGEDFVDEMVTGSVSKGLNDYFAPIRKDLTSNLEDGLLKDSLDSALTTLQFGIQVYAINKLTELFFDKALVTASLMWAYINSGGVKKRLKKAVNSFVGGFSKIPLVGRVGANVFKSVMALDDKTSDRIAIAGQIQHFQSDFVKAETEYRKEKIKEQELKNSGLDTQINLKSSSSMASLEHFKHLTMIGGWKLEHKNLYFSVVGKTNANGTPIVFNKKFIESLNSFSTYAKDLEGNILNSAQVQMDLLLSSYTKVK